MINQSILTLASKLILASTMDDEKELQRVSAELAAELNKENSGESTPPALYKDEVGFLNFTNKEISKMPKAFRHTFIAEGKVICYRKRKRGKISCSYEARYRRNGYNLSVSAKNLIELKDKFIEALHEHDQSNVFPKVPTTFHEFATYYFETFRKRKVSKETFKADLGKYKIYLYPYFGSTPLRSISPAQCQTLLDKIISEGHNKTEEDIYSLLNVIFKTALAHGIIDRNPLAIVVHETHERQHGKALSLEEEKKLLKESDGSPYQVMFAIALYTGLRPNEYKTARIDGDFIVAVNSKRKNKKVEYKKIPITPMLKPYLKNVTEIKFYIPECMRDKFRSILPNHKLYDLRTTFYTRCHECGVADVARMEFVGHSLGVLGDTYTDLSDEFLMKEGKKLDY